LHPYNNSPLLLATPSPEFAFAVRTPTHTGVPCDTIRDGVAPERV